MKYYKYFLLTIGIILLDQIIKITVFYTFDYQGDEVKVFGDWFKLHYITNPGMAFGITFGGSWGKVFLTVFRIFAMGGIAYYLIKMANKDAHPGFLWAIGGILGGAIGNLIDSIFYGVIFGDELIAMIPNPNNEGGYMYPPTPWFHGKVIDMFYVDICNCYIPAWVPLIGNQYYPLWPIWNFADASIFVSVLVIVIFQKRFFDEKVMSN